MNGIVMVIAMSMIAALLLGMIFTLFMLKRNDWVLAKRLGVLNDPNLSIYKKLEQYERLISYDQMLWRFWVWDIRKFMRPE